MNSILKGRRPRASGHRLLAFVVVGGVNALAGLALAAPAVATTGGCSLSAKITDLTPSTGSNQYTMSGRLASCTSNTAGTPRRGSIGQGQTYTESVPITQADGTVVQGTARYKQSPGFWSPCGSLGFGSGDWIIGWAGGTNTVIGANFTVSNGVFVWGGPFGSPAVESGTSLNEVPGTENPAGTAPGSYFVSSDSGPYKAGQPTSAQLALSPKDPTSCHTNGYMGNASLNGTLELGLG